MNACRRMMAIALFGAIALWSAAAAAQSSTVQSSSTQTRQFEVLSVVGNQVVIRNPDGTREYTVPEDFRFNVDGKQLSVHDLKVGMKGTATTTTLTTVRTVYVTETRNVRVLKANGNSIVFRANDGTWKLFTQEDIDKYHVQIIRNGKPAEFQQLKDQDSISATFIAPKQETLTEQQVVARLENPASAAVVTAAAPAAKTAAATSAAATKSATTMAASAPAKVTPAPAGSSSTAEPAAPKKLPKTASSLPLIGLLGMALLALGSAMTFVRRRRTA